MAEWTTACLDWEKRLVERASIIPAPIFADQAEYALGIFKELRVSDLPGNHAISCRCRSFSTGRYGP